MEPPLGALPGAQETGVLPRAQANDLTDQRRVVLLDLAPLALLERLQLPLRRAEGVLQHRVDVGFVVTLARMVRRSADDQLLAGNRQVDADDRNVALAMLPVRRLYGDPARHQPSVPLVQLRSEEHTSELKSLMRISYAVLCLKK